jgi:hypothetical protein
MVTIGPRSHGIDESLNLGAHEARNDIEVRNKSSDVLFNTTRDDRIVRVPAPPCSPRCLFTEIVAHTRTAQSHAPSCAAQCRARTTEMPPKKKKNKDDDWEAEAEALAAENDGTAPPSASAAAGDDDDDAGTKPAKKVCAS